MSDIYEKAAPDLEAYRRELRPEAGQRGAVFAVGGRVAGLDLFDAPGTREKFWGKLVSSYALDAVEAEVGRVVPLRPEGLEADVRAFVADVVAARPERFPVVGLGCQVRLAHDGVAGGGLVHEGRVVHLAAFRLHG